MKLKSLLIFLLLSSSTIFSMKRPQEETLQEKRKPQTQAAQQGKYFVYDSNNPLDGIWVSKAMVEQSKSLKDMVEDLGEMGGKEIPLNAPIHIIQIAFGILENKIDVNSLSFDDLIDVSNLLNFLDVPNSVMSLIVKAIQRAIYLMGDNIMLHNKALQRLNRDWQQLLLVGPMIKILKEKYINDHKKILACPPHVFEAITFNNGTQVILSHNEDLILWDISKPYYTSHKVLITNSGIIRSAMFSSDGKKIISAIEDTEEFTLWDISNPNNITHKILKGYGEIRNIVFSPDGKKIITSSYGEQNNLILWDITDPNNITHKILQGYKGLVDKIVFSLDGKKIITYISGFPGRNGLILWDISDEDKITSYVIVQGTYIVSTMAFSPDNTKIVVGFDGDKNNLILWDISNPNKMVYKILSGHPESVTTVAFSHDGKNIISGCDGDKNNLILGNISNPNSITYKILSGHPGSITSALFSPDGKAIVSGCYSKENNLILWDISNANALYHMRLKGHSASAQPFLSPDGKVIFSRDDMPVESNKFILWNLPTDQEEALFNQIKNYTFEQILFLYQFCKKLMQYKHFILLKKGTEEYNIFMSLPEEMRLFLHQIIKIAIYGD